MQKQNWEYLHIVCDAGQPRYVNRQEIPNWQRGPTLFEVVNFLVRKDWELIDNPFAPNPVWLAYRPAIPHHFRRFKK
jgi:hypothetical protein